VSTYLKAFIAKDPAGFSIEPASAKRDWMDATPHKFAYHCMPLTIANQAGWVIRFHVTFAATWNGAQGPESVTFRFSENETLGRQCVSSHFGSGILTFAIPWIFRTSPGWGLIVRGPANAPKDTVAPLDGLVETDWAPYTFTMNWKIMKRNTEAWFRAGEPVCMLMPYPLAAPEDVVPSFHQLEEDPAFANEFMRWAHQRVRSVEQFHATGQRETHKSYMRGKLPDGTEAPEHRVNYKLRPFAPPPGGGA
jgi:hypothetical protein